MKEILEGKISELQEEHNRVCNAMVELKSNLEKLNNRRIELEGAMKEILEVLNMSEKKVDDISDTESKTPQRTDTYKG